MLPFLDAHPYIVTLQQDNARPHAAHVTREFMEENGVQVMPWVPYSPDLSPVEHVWDELGRRVARRGPSTRPQLIQVLHEEWEAIPQATIARLIRSMRTRCQECNKVALLLKCHFSL